MPFFKNLITVSFLFLLSFTTCAQDTVFLKKQAKRLAAATFNGDHQTVIALTYPELIKLSGGKEQMQKLITEKIESLKKQGVMKFDGSIGSPGPFYKAGDQIHCLLPETLVLKTFSGRYVGRSYLLAVTNDKGKSWTFLDVGNMPADVLHRLLPNYNESLVIPASGKPMFFAD
jgi:hypothetical protein